MKRIALSLIILALAVSARAETRPIAAGTPAGVVTLCGDDGDGNCTLGGAGLDVSGSTVDLGDIGPAATAAKQQCIAPATGKTAYSTVTNGATTVDAGCTLNAAWLKASNLHHTADVEFTDPSGAQSRIGPLQSEFFCEPSGATPDHVVFDSICDTCASTGRVTITAGCN